MISVCHKYQQFLAKQILLAVIIYNLASALRTLAMIVLMVPLSMSGYKF